MLCMDPSAKHARVFLVVSPLFCLCYHNGITPARILNQAYPLSTCRFHLIVLYSRSHSLGATTDCRRKRKRDHTGIPMINRIYIFIKHTDNI